MQVSLRLHLGCGYSGDAKVPLHLGVALCLPALTGGVRSGMMPIAKPGRRYHCNRPAYADHLRTTGAPRYGRAMAIVAVIDMRDVLNAYQDLGPTVMVLAAIWALAHCLTGRVVFRALLIGDAVIAGAVLGGAALAAFYEASSGIDYFVAASSGAALMGILAWFAAREIFAVLIALAVGALTLATVGWLLAAPLAVVCGLVARTYFRRAVTLVGAVCGAVGVTISSAALVAGHLRLWEYLFGQRRQVWLLMLLVIVTAILTAAGMFTQRGLMKILRTSLTPEYLLRRGRKHGPMVRLRFSRT